MRLIQPLFPAETQSRREKDWSLRLRASAGALLFFCLAAVARAAAPVTVLVDPSTYVLVRPTAAQLSNANNLGTGGGGGGSYIFTAADFNESGSTISLDYTNGQKATSLIPGFLSAADWITFNAKAPTASPTFTGTPVAPTAAADTNTTQLATTAFVIGQSYLKASTAASTYQGLDSDLTSIAALATTSFGRGLLTESSASTLRSTLSLVPGTNFLAYPSGTPTGSKFLRDDNTWQSIAGGGDALVANPLSQFAATTSAQLAGVLSDEAGSSGGFVRAGYLGSAALEASSAFQAADGDLTTYANITPSANVQSLLGAADYSAMRTQLSLVPGTNVQAYDADLTTYAGITPSANIQTFLGAANYAAMRTQLGLVISTDVQAYDSDLTTWGSTTPASGITTFLATPSSANLASAITNETGTGALVFASDPLLLAPNSAMGALAVDVTKKRNTKTVSADSTLTFSATPTAGFTFGLVLTNSDTAAHTITIPSSKSLARNGTAITSFSIPASSELELSWTYDGSSYSLAGEPFTINDLTTVTPATGDYLPLYDSSGAVDGKATIANILALGGGGGTWGSITGTLSSQSDLQTALDAKAPVPTVNAQTGTSYTLVLTDANKLVTMTNASANTLTIPLNSSVAFPTGTVVVIGQGGAGATSIAPASGATINGSGSTITFSSQYTFTSIVKTGTNAWLTYGGDFVVSNSAITGATKTKITYDTKGLVTAGADAAQADITGLTTSDSPQFTGINVGHATDTTVTRASAGDIAVEGNRVFRVGGSTVGLPDVWVIPIGDETTALTTGTAKVTFRAPYAATVTAVYATLTTASSSGTPTFDINEAGTTILSTKITIDASEDDSANAATAPVISDTAIANRAKITIDVDTAGTGAAGAKIEIHVTRA